jgi:hypothetical protein
MHELRSGFGRHLRIAADADQRRGECSVAWHYVCNGAEAHASSRHRTILFTPGELIADAQTAENDGMKAKKPMQLRRALALLTTLGLANALDGCAAAPSITVGGAYFPAWLVCGLIGVLGAIVSRLVLAGSGLAQTLPLQLLVCLSVGVVCAALAWVGWVAV